MLKDLSALIAGLLLPLAFSPFDQPFIAILSLATLLWAWQDATPIRAFGRGYLFGLGQFGVGVSWVFISMHLYGGASVPEGLGLTSLFVGFLALYPALVGWLTGKFIPHRPISRHVIAVPALWTLLEWLRGWLLSGFPWLSLGYSQTGTPLGNIAPILGGFGVSWIVLLAAGLALNAIQLKGGLRRASGIALIAVLGVSALLGRVEWSEPSGAALSVALIQGNVAQNLKWQPEVQQETLRRYLAMTRRHWDARVVVWPETAVPAFYQQLEKSVLPALRAEAADHGTSLLLGIPYFKQDPDRYYNALTGLGTADGIYFKRHLVPFGEYLPLRPLLGWILEILEIPLSDFAPGAAEQQPIIAAGLPVAGSICYEDIFGHESRAGLPEAAFLVNVTNDAWFGDSMAPHQHVQMARMRAKEAGRYLLRATNTGVTAIIDARGQMVRTAPLFQEAELTGEILPMQGATPYVRFGDAPLVAIMLVLLGLAIRLGIHAASDGSPDRGSDPSTR